MEAEAENQVKLQTERKMQGVHGNGVHILAIPFPAGGHILPNMDLIHQLLVRGVTVTILVTPKNLHYLNPLLSLHSPNNNVHTLVLPFPPHPSIPNGVENMAGLPLSFGPIFFSAMTKLEDPLFQWFQTHPSPPVAIISDMLLSSWVNTLASRLNIHNLSFMTFNANSVLSIMQKCQKNKLDTFGKDVLVPCLTCWGTIFNTFSELDGDKMKILKDEFSKHYRLWAVGPLQPIKVNNSERGIGPGSIPQDQVIAWLDSCDKDKSVVYVVFGTQITLTKSQMEAIAFALEKSGVRFIWAVREPNKENQINGDDNQNLVPPGFEERLGGKGLVIKGWTPQLAILEHRAVGSFLTHCGWNSALEGLLGGVLLLAWPMQADNFDNTKLFADELGVAIRVCEGLNTVPDATKLAQILSDSVNMELPERVQAMKLRQAATEATLKGGSSDKALDGLVDALFSLI